jgi:hypothetical protein
MSDVMTDAERRLQAARPVAADVPADAPDSAEGLAVLAAARTRIPTAASGGGARSPRRARRVVARATVLGAAATMAGVIVGWPASDTGPRDAMARPVALAIRWFDPAPGTILHVRSTIESRAPDGGTSRLVQELWQSVDHPERVRTVSIQDGIRAEFGWDGLYDHRTDTVYVAPTGRAPGKALNRKLPARKERGDDKLARKRDDAQQAPTEKVLPPAQTPPAGDPVTTKVKFLLENGSARVDGRERGGSHVITLVQSAAAEAAPWRLRVAPDGRPIDVRVAATEGVQAITWQTYELLRADDADRLLTVRGAHPGARIVRDPDAYEAARARMAPEG